MSGRQTWVETLLDFIQDPQLNKDNVVCWNEKGDGFLMVNKAKKKEALAKFFNTSDPESFRRNLNYHGFKSIGRSPTHYTHPHMRRHDRAYTLRHVTRTDPGQQAQASSAASSSTAGAGTGVGAPESPAAEESDAEDAEGSDAAPTASVKSKGGIKAGGHTGSEPLPARPRKPAAADAPTKRSRSRDSGSGIEKDSQDCMEEDEQQDGASREGQPAHGRPAVETRMVTRSVLPTAGSSFKQRTDHCTDEMSYTVISDGDGGDGGHASAVSHSSNHPHQPTAPSMSTSASVSALLGQVTETEEGSRRKRRRSGEDDDAGRQQQGRKDRDAQGKEGGGGGSHEEEPGRTRAQAFTAAAGTAGRTTRLTAGSLKPPSNVPPSSASSAPPSAGLHEDSGISTAAVGASGRHVPPAQAQGEGISSAEASEEGSTAGRERVAKREKEEGRRAAAAHGGSRGVDEQARVSSSSAAAAVAGGGEIMGTRTSAQEGKERVAWTDKQRKDVRAPPKADEESSEEEAAGTDDSSTGTGEVNGARTGREDRGRGKGTAFVRSGKPTRSAAAASSAAVTKAMKAKLEGMSEEEKRINAPLLQGSHPLIEHPSLAALSRYGSGNVQPPEPSAPAPPADDPDDAAFFLLGLTQSGASSEAPLAIRPPIPEDGPCGAGIGGMPCAKPTCHTCNTVTGTPQVLRDGAIPSLGYMHRLPASSSTAAGGPQSQVAHLVGRSDPISLGNGLPVHVRAPSPVPVQGHAHAGQQYGGSPHIVQQSQGQGVVSLGLGQGQGQGQGGLIVWMPMQYAGNGQYRPLQANEIPLQPMPMPMGNMGSAGQQVHMSVGGSAGGHVSMGPPPAPSTHPSMAQQQMHAPQQQHVSPGPQYYSSNSLPTYSHGGVGGMGGPPIVQPQGLPMAQGAPPGTIYYSSPPGQGQGMGQGQHAGPTVLHQLHSTGSGQAASLGSLGISGLSIGRTGTGTGTGLSIGRTGTGTGTGGPQTSLVSMNLAGGQAPDMHHSAGPGGALSGPPLTVQQAQAYANTGVKLPSGQLTTQTITQHQYALANTGVKIPSNNALSVQS